MEPNNMRVVSSWCSCVPRPALGKISVIHSWVASFGRVADSSQPLLGSWVSGSSACCGPRWGWQNSTCDQIDVTPQWLPLFFSLQGGFGWWLRMASQRYIPAEYLPVFWPLPPMSVVWNQALSPCASAPLLWNENYTTLFPSNIWK